jgi:hypothetical protein
LSYLIWIVGVLAWLGLVWLSRVITHVRRRRRIRWPMVAAAPALALGVVVATDFVDPLDVRWQHARPEFDREAGALLADPNPVVIDSTNIAGYDIAPVVVRRGTVYFYVRGAGFLNNYGFAYHPDTARIDEKTYHSLGNGWYTFVEPWSGRPETPAQIRDDNSRT